MMQQPAFWHRPAGIWAWMLAPLSWIWAWATARRMAATTPQSAGIPVICVGNLTVGGTGKTPTVCAIAGRLQARGINVHVLSRGYGGSMDGPVQVDPVGHSTADVGDEPLLLSAFAPVWVAKDRLAGAHAAKVAGADVIVMDDGFQNPGLVKDFSVIVVDGPTGFGNRKVMPAGPLREPIAVGMARADAVLCIGVARKIDTPDLDKLPMVGGTLEPLETGMQWPGLNALAFAGIGKPEKFFTTLRAAGANIVGTQSFPDHAEYPRILVERLLAEAKAKSAQLVTTEKDAVRLPPDLRRQVLVFPVRLQLDDWSILDAAFDRLGLG